MTSSDDALTNPVAGFAQTGFATPVATPAAPDAGAIEPQTGFVTIDGLEMYYEVHGTATGSHPPLLLLHGGLLTIDLAFGQLIPVLAQSRQVIAIDLKGHGRTVLTERPLSYEQMADDAAALLQEIGPAQVDIFGYSLGGGVALQIAIRHPDLVRKLVVASAPVRADGWHPEILGAMASLGPEAAAVMEATPLYQAYAAVAPNPDDWSNLVTRVGQLTTGEYDWSADVAAIAAPTLLIFGDADSVRPEHIVEMLQVLGGGVVGDMGQTANVQLAVLPNTAHSAVLMQVDLLLAVIVPFLDAPMPDPA